MKRHNWKREAKCWKGFAALQQLVIAAVAHDKLYQCQCGNEPYTDGDMCPKCFAEYAYYEMQEMQKRWAAAAEGGK